MIANRAAATTLFEAAYAAYHRLYAALEEISPDLPPDEEARVKQAIGRVMGDILFELTEPILERHPELLPPEWSDADPK